MKKAVLVALADKKYLTQAKQLFSTAYWNSGWSGDYLLLAYDTPKSELAWFLSKGIEIRHCPPRDCGSPKLGDKITSCKCLLFSEYFKQWDHVVYLDVDILTRGSLDGLIGLDGFSACHSLGQTLGDNFIGPEDMPSNVADTLKNFEWNEDAFNSGVMAFPTSIIYKGMYEELMAVFARYVNFGSFGGDQLPLNIFFYRKWIKLPAAYNQITPVNEQSYDVRNLQGLVIHCVSFGNGPWDKRSVLHEEWRANLQRADSIELKRVPNARVPSDAEIGTRSKSVMRAHVLGGNVSVPNVFKLFLRAGRLVVTNPMRLLGKLRSVRG